MSFRNTTDHRLNCVRLLDNHSAITKQVTIDGDKLTLPEVFEVSRNKNVQVQVKDDNKEKGMQNGASKEDVTDQRRFFQVGMGRNLPTEMVRSAMLVRANHNCASEAGIKGEAIKLLVELLNRNIIPNVPERGSTSATGDLVQMTYVASCLAGNADVYVNDNGERKSADEALKDAGLKPVTLTPNETVSLINSDAFCTGIAACAVYNANIMAMLTQVATGMAVEALFGRTESFHHLLHDCLPHLGQKETGRNMLGIMKNTKIAISILDMYIPDEPGKLKQDRYSLRSSPQWLSPVLETLSLATQRVEVQLNASTEKPVTDHCTDLLTGGNAQGMMMAMTMDQTRQALQICGKLIFAQFQEVVNDKLNYGLPHNLAGSDPANDQGFIGLDIAMASYMTELDHVTNPTSNHIQGSESHNQSTNSMGLFSARLTIKALEIIRMMLASHILLLAQAVDLRWLSFRVQEILAARVEKNSGIARLVAKNKWWKFVYQVDSTTSLVAEALPEDEREAFINSLRTDLKNIIAVVVSSPAKIQADMGDGTSRLYGYVRNTLQIPFNRGERSLDASVSKIYNSIESLEIESVMLEVFKMIGSKDI
ncbi:unnamed protein product [Owenia fusiformis]|uniref:Uncharacterized protein n=1 Tax=Owenia fusiformis TaxID=6347 RepID=A0A8J1XV75_OWEFU|nr:unnamed protein product [Owenia fusiformis]